MKEHDVLRNNDDKMYVYVLVAGIIFIAINLRPSITSIGPLFGLIREDMAIANWAVGLLTTLPLIVFAFMSTFAVKIGKKLTNEWALFLGLMILMSGIILRSVSVVSLLIVGTLLIGMGIAICNVLLPSTIKEKFPTKVGLMTSLYSTSMGVFAATASGLSIPVAVGAGLGWQLALLMWIVPAIIAMMIWLYIALKNSNGKVEKVASHQYGKTQNMWRSPLAWQIALFLGLQSFLFYVTISWLPEILHHAGVDIALAGWLLAIAQLVGLPASFFAPIIAGKYPSQSLLVGITGSFAVLGFLGLLISNSSVIIYISTMLIGITLGGGFALALTFLGLRARTASDAASLSGMAQSIGYLLAAVGPILIGFTYDITQEWQIPLVILLCVSILAVVFGMRSGRDAYVGE